MKKDNHVDKIRRTLAEARMCHEGWWLLVGQHSDRDEIVLMANRYLFFFQTIKAALFVTFVMKLTSLFSTHKRDITLKSIEEIEQDGSFETIWELGRKLYTYRNKLIAHIDLAVDPEDHARKIGLSYNDVKKLLDETCDMFDSAAERLGVEAVPPLSCKVDFLRLVRNVRE